VKKIFLTALRYVPKLTEVMCINFGRHSIYKCSTFISHQMSGILIKKVKYISCYLLCIGALSSCSSFRCNIAIHEVAYIQKNGDGKFEIVVDLRKAEKAIKFERLISRSKSEYIQELIYSALQVTGRKLKKIPGIGDISIAYDPKMLYFSLSFLFLNIESLNKAMGKINGHLDPPHLIYFKKDHNSFIRIDTRSIVKLIEYYQLKDDSHIASFDLKTFFKNITYQTIYSFDREIQRVTNPSAVISDNRKMVILKRHLLKEAEKELSISNEVFF
jgi:hypothetical protein